MSNYCFKGQCYDSCLHRFFPFGLNGILAGAAVVFFSYIGFDTVTSTAEEVYSLLNNRTHFKDSV